MDRIRLIRKARRGVSDKGIPQKIIYPNCEAWII